MLSLIHILENLLDEVSSEAYDKAVDKVAFMLLTVGCFCFGVFLLFQPVPDRAGLGLSLIHIFTIFHVFVTMRMAAADLNTHLKIIQVSTSCRLFLSAIIWIRSTVITIARITPAIGTMMELDRFSIMLKILPFHPCGVWPTCTDISATCWFTLSNLSLIHIFTLIVPVVLNQT